MEPTLGLPALPKYATPEIERLVTVALKKLWLARTYRGIGAAEDTAALNRAHVAAGSNALSIAFDLVTQLYLGLLDPVCVGEVGRTGVSVSHFTDFRAMFEGIEIGKVNTSMTINASANWLYAQHLCLAQEQGVSLETLRGTVQNDLLKEGVARGAIAFPPEASLRMAVEVLEHAALYTPGYNAMNGCGYHYVESGASTAAELGFTFANMRAIFEAVKQRGRVPVEKVISICGFFMNSTTDFFGEVAKRKAADRMWRRLTREYGAERGFVSGLQTCSYGLSARSPLLNLVRMIIALMGASASPEGRIRAAQLPGIREALGIPKEEEQLLSLLSQYVWALEGLSARDPSVDYFAGAPAMEQLVKDTEDEAVAIMEEVGRRGGAYTYDGIRYMKGLTVQSMGQRLAQLRTGERFMVGETVFADQEVSLLQSGDDQVLEVDPAREGQLQTRLEDYLRKRDNDGARTALDQVERLAKEGQPLIPALIEAAKAGATTGEVGAIFYQLFGRYEEVRGTDWIPGGQLPDQDLVVQEVRAAAARYSVKLPIKILTAQMGLDGHSVGVNQITRGCRDAGLEVVFIGIRQTAPLIAETALQDDVAIIGISSFAGAHRGQMQALRRELDARGAHDIPIVLGGIIPSKDQQFLKEDCGVKEIYTPGQMPLRAVMADMIRVVGEHAAAA